MPDDGVHSATRTGVQITATPKNFAGTTASLPAPNTPITGTPGDDSLTGSVEPDHIVGLAGNDTLEGKAADDSLDGGPGVDLAVYSAARAVATFSATANGYTANTAVDGADGLANIERLESADLSVALGASHQAVVDLLYTNVAGSPPPPDEAAMFVSLLDGHVYTVPGLGVYAAEYFLNLSNIDLVGLSQQGLEYVPHSAG